MPRWIIWTLLTVFTWGIWAILFKSIGGGISEAHIQVMSTLGVLPIIAVLLATKDSSTINRPRGILLALGSGIVSCLGNIGFYSVLKGGAKAAAVIPVTALYPVVTVLLAVPLLKERLNRLQVIGVGVSLAAIYLFNVSQEQNLLSSWLLMALVPIALWGICGLMQKMSTDYISGRSSAVWFLLSFLPVAVLIMAYDPLPAGMSWKMWGIACAIGFTLALGNLTILLAFSSGGKASIVAPLAGLYPLVSLPIARYAFDERIGWREFWGIVLALVAVVMLSYQSEPGEDAATKNEMDASL